MTDFRLPSATSSLRAMKFSATRRPISCGDVPAGHLLKYACACSCCVQIRMIPQASANIKFRRYTINPPILLSSDFFWWFPTGAQPSRLPFSNSRVALSANETLALQSILFVRHLLQLHHFLDLENYS